jgi:transmembrane sensor
MNQNTLISKYVSGNASPSEKESLERLMMEDASVQEQVQIAKILWENTSSMTEMNTENLWNRIDSETKYSKRSRIIPLRRSVTRVAAVVAFFVLSVFIFKLLEKETVEQGIVLNTQVSTKLVGLSDGSVTKIQPYSNLVLDENFNQEDRKVRLTGNAYFVVKPDKQRIFEVSTAHLKVFVLGTAFSVEENGAYTQVVVDEGRVKVEVGKETYYLTAKEKLSVENGKVLVSEYKHSRMNQLAAKNPAISFESVELKHVIQSLEAEHNCTIQTRENLLNKKLTLSLENLSLQQKLEILSELTSTKVSEEEGVFYLK